MISIDLSAATTPLEISTAIEQAFPTQLNTDNVTLQSNMNDLTFGSGQNCSVLGSVNALLRKAESAFKMAIKDASDGLESIINEVNKKVGEAIATCQAAFDSIKNDVAEYCDWLKTQVATVVDEMKAAYQQVQDACNDVIQGLMGYINQITDAISDIAQKMYDSLKSMVVLGCTDLSNSVADIGHGAGIDNIVDTAKAEADNAATVASQAVTSAVQDYSVSMKPLPDLIPSASSQANKVSSSSNGMKQLMSE